MVRDFFNVIIIDDEEDQVELFKDRIKLYHNHVKVVATADNITDGYQVIVKFLPDLVFLDVEMPGGNGFQLAKLIRENRISTKIVIVSARARYAYDAIKISVFDYIKKPFTAEELANTLKKVELDKLLIDIVDQRKILMQDVFRKMYFKVGTKDYFATPEDIVYCQTKNNKVVILQLNNMDTPILITETLKSLEDKLPNALFFRIQPSILINIKYLQQIKRTLDECILVFDKGSAALKGSRSQIVNLRQTLHEIY